MNLHSEVKDAIRLAARFGYISQSVFRDLVTTKRRAMQYELWKRMKDLKIFVPYEYRYKSEEFLRLTKQGRILASQLGVMPIHAPFVNQLLHDELLVRFILLNERAGHIKDAMTETEIKSSGMFHGQIGNIKTKLPDIYFKLNGHGISTRIAVEFERTRKSNERYRQCLLSYMFLKEVDAVLFIISSPAIEATVRAVGVKNHYNFKSRPLLFASSQDVIKNPTSFPLRLSQRVLNFDQFIQELRELKAKAA